MPLKTPYSVLMPTAKPVWCAYSGWKASVTPTAYLVRKMPIISASGTALPGWKKRRVAAS